MSKRMRFSTNCEWRHRMKALDEKLAMVFIMTRPRDTTQPLVVIDMPNGKYVPGGVPVTIGRNEFVTYYRPVSGKT